MIDGVELEGLEQRYYTVQFDNNGKSKLKLVHTAHGAWFDTGYQNIISYKGTQYNMGGGTEFGDKIMSFLFPSTKDFNGPWNRIKNLEGKSEKYLDNFFGVRETWEDQKKREDKELEDRIVGDFEDAFMAGVGGRKGGILEAKIEGQTRAKTGKTSVRTGTVTVEAKAVKISEVKDLVGHRRHHILNRHRAGTEKPGKTEFPKDWSDNKIIKEVNKIANDPNAPGGIGAYGAPYKTGTVEGINIRVDFYPPNHPRYSGKVSTAYPTNVVPNPN